MNRWNPAAYLKYEKERTQPSRDLAARLRSLDARSIVDVGCGPGNSTGVLREMWPKARVLGLDSSEAMLAKAREACPQEEWVLADAATWRTDERFDVVFSNAVLQWIPDQPSVIANLFAHLAPGGALAVQVPQVARSPVHRALLAVSERPEWNTRLAGAGLGRELHDEEFYYRNLCSLTDRLELWVTIYLHIMNGHQDILDWYAGTGMKPYLDRLDGDEERRRFSREILESCRDDYPVQPDGKVMFPFRRLFFIAWKQAD